MSAWQLFVCIGCLVAAVHLGCPAPPINTPWVFSLPSTLTGGCGERDFWHQGRAGELLLPENNGGCQGPAPPHQVGR